MLKRIVLVAAALVLVSSVSFADTIVLKSGKQIEGVILERSQDSIKLDFNGATVIYPLEEVDTVNGETPVIFSPQVNPDVAVEIDTPVAQDKPQAVAGTQPPADQAVAVTAQAKSSPASVSLKVDIEKPSGTLNKSYQAEVNPSKVKPVAEAVSLVMLILIFLIMVAFYVYSSFCLQLIAKKTGTAPAWLAWIPAANVFLMCKIGSVNYWWIAVLVLSFLPFVGAAVSVAFFGFVWYKIALARNKSGWLGILAVVPVANLVLYGYLAFSKDKGNYAQSIVLPPGQPQAPQAKPPEAIPPKGPSA